jgi:hypothetical protein
MTENFAVFPREETRAFPNFEKKRRLTCMLKIFKTIGDDGKRFLSLSLSLFVLLRFF